MGGGEEERTSGHSPCTRNRCSNCHYAYRPSSLFLFPLLNFDTYDTCYIILCYVILCYVMLCYVMLCYVMLCYVMLCYVMLYYVMLCYVKLS
jgi:hypothetical protein